MKNSLRVSTALRVILAVVVFQAPASPQRLQYPQTKKVDQADRYFGARVEDPYRWLENENAPETAAWVEAENKVTFDYLAKIPYRDALKARLSKLQNYARFGAPRRKCAN